MLYEIQQALKAPKDQKNDFGGYQYRSAEQILSIVKPLLDGAELTLTDDIVQVGDRIYVKATAKLHKDGETRESTAFAREPAHATKTGRPSASSSTV